MTETNQNIMNDARLGKRKRRKDLLPNWICCFMFSIVLLSCSLIRNPPDIQMHRIQAATPGESGWYYAKSSEGNFSAQLPIPFNDFTSTVKSKEAGVVKSYIVGSKSKEGISFAVTEMTYGKNVSDAKLDNLLKGFQKPGYTITEVNKENYQGCPAISFIVFDNKNGLIGKYIKTTKGLITMMIEFPIEYRKIATQYSSQFFSSLSVT